MYTPVDPAGDRDVRAVMGRSLLLLALLYVCGDARFEIYRPAAFDRPVREFRRAVEQAVIDGRRALAVLDDARSMRYLAPLMRRLDGAL